MEVAYEICKRNQWDPQTGRQLRASHSEIPIEQDFEQETAPRTTAVDITPLNKGVRYRHALLGSASEPASAMHSNIRRKRNLRYRSGISRLARKNWRKRDVFGSILDYN